MKKELKISKNVVVLGLVSFFNDVASEMIYPLVPIFLTGILNAPASIVGLIEGIAEATSSFLQTFSGWLSDKLKKRKILVVSGYSFSAFSKIFLGLAYSWPIVLFSRFIDRLGKGIRTSARDALISESTDQASKGFSFGLHRALDTLGAVIGPLLTLLLIHYLNNQFRLIFFISFIPAFIAILLLILFVKEKIKENSSPSLTRIRWADFNSSFKIFLLVSIIFALGNSSNAFLLLKAKNLGFSTTLVILLYTLYNLTYALFSTPAGIIADKIGAKKVMIIGFFIFAFVYFLIGYTVSGVLLWVLFPIYGIYIALTDGVGKAYISNLVSHDNIATAFGIYQTAIGLATFFASSLAGLMWTYINPQAPFIFGSILALIAAFIFILFGKRN